MPMIGVRKTAGSKPPATPVIPVIAAVTKATAQTRRRSINSKFGYAHVSKAVSWEKGPEDNPPSGCMMVNHGQTNAAS